MNRIDMRVRAVEALDEMGHPDLASKIIREEIADLDFEPQLPVLADFAKLPLPRLAEGR